MAAALLREAGADFGRAPGLPSPLAPTPVASEFTPTARGNPVSSPGPHISAAEIDDALANADPAMRDLVLERMLAAWVPADPQAAARYAELQADSFLREVALRTVAHRWTPIDRDAAARWATSLGDDAERRDVMADVALAMADSDPRAALDLLAQRGGDEQPDTARVGVVASWASRDFAAAQSWVEAEPPGPGRDDIVLHLAFLRAQTDPAAATRLADELLGDGRALHDAHASILQLAVARQESPRTD